MINIPNSPEIKDKCAGKPQHFLASVTNDTQNTGSDIKEINIFVFLEE